MAIPSMISQYSYTFKLDKNTFDKITEWLVTQKQYRPAPEATTTPTKVDEFDWLILPNHEEYVAKLPGTQHALPSNARMRQLHIWTSSMGGAPIGAQVHSINYYIGVSEKVFNNQEFREFLTEILMDNC